MRNLLLLFIALASCSCSSTFTYEVNYSPEKQLSVIYLKHGEKTVDSCTIEDYYGKNSLYRLSDSLWGVDYAVRCGSGCTAGNTILLNVIGDKINIPLHIVREYRDTTFERTVKLKYSQGKLQANITYNKGGSHGTDDERSIVINYNDSLFTNTRFSYDSKVYPGIKIDSLEYIRRDGSWYEYSDAAKRIYRKM